MPATTSTCAGLTRGDCRDCEVPERETLLEEEEEEEDEEMSQRTTRTLTRTRIASCGMFIVVEDSGSAMMRFGDDRVR